MHRIRPVIPHEHGGWSMVIVPFLLGVIAGGPEWVHIPLFLGWLLFYLAAYPMLQWFKPKTNRVLMARWAAGYGTAACVFTLPALFYEPALLWLAPFLVVLILINYEFARRRKERLLANDLFAVAAFSLGGVGATIVGTNSFGALAWYVWTFSFLFFFGSIYFVKSIIRERGNARWLWAGYAFHALLLVAPFTLGLPLLSLAYVLPAVRMFALGGRKIKAKTAGIIEIVGSVWFLVLCGWFLSS